jgi:hypothetical protein
MKSIVEYALMAASAYQFARSGANRVVPPSGTGREENFEYYTRDQDTGFEAKVFKRGANEFVIAFTGTDEWRDWITNASAALGWISNPLKQAAALYARVVEENEGAQVSFTGHSLGGGLASLMGVFFDRPAVTFDQAPFKASASEANRSALLDSLAAAGFGDGADPAVQAIRNTLRGFTADSFVERQSRVSDYSVAGEILSSELIPLNRIGPTVEVIQGRAATGADDDTVDAAPARTISTAAVTTMTSSQALRDVLTRLPVTQGQGHRLAAA